MRLDKIKARLDKLERRKDSETAVSGIDWDAFNRRDPSWADGLIPSEKERLAGSPVLEILRAEWARLGIPEPDDLEGTDVIEEAIRLAGLPDHSSTQEVRDGGE